MTGQKTDDRFEIIGHGEILDFLASAWERGQLAHAYLLTGPTGVGKAEVARWLARKVLGTDNLEAHPDFSSVERGANAKTGKLQNAIVIDQIHELRGRLSLGSMMGGWKVAVLEGAERLNEAAANALLKTLEEPHAKTVLILTADTNESVMPTVRSRCQTVILNRVSRTEIAAGLAERGIDPPKADLAARLSGGCPGRALALATDRDTRFRMTV